MDFYPIFRFKVKDSYNHQLMFPFERVQGILLYLSFVSFGSPCNVKCKGLPVILNASNQIDFLYVQLNLR